MKISKLALIALALASTNLFASGDGKNEAQEVCTKIVNSITRSECRQVVSESNIWDLDAVIVIDGFKNDLVKVDALKVIKGKTFAPGKATECNNINSLVARDCLGKLSSPIVPSRSSTNTSTSAVMATDSQVKGYCIGYKSQWGSNDKCLALIEGAPKVELAALKICSKLQSLYGDGPHQLGCLELIVNNHFDEKVGECTFATEKVSCLQGHLK